MALYPICGFDPISNGLRASALNKPKHYLQMNGSSFSFEKELPFLKTRLTAFLSR